MSDLRGFSVLLAMGPNGPLGHVTAFLEIAPLAFTFPGLVIASVLYSLPFMVQPLQSAFASIGERPLEMAATLRASPLDRFFSELGRASCRERVCQYV